MNVVIIEDERLTAEDLKDIILHLAPDAHIVAMLSSVKEAVNYLQKHAMPDLIFSDIQLGDGLSFEIYKQVEVNAPIVFCTAYDEYALEAFDANGIHYVLKPFDEDSIAQAIKKYQDLKSAFSINEEAVNVVLDALKHRTGARPTSILVYQQDKVIPIKVNDIALFFIRNEVCHLFTFDQKLYYINKSLDEVQQMVGEMFFRANRQFIVHRNAIKEVSQALSRKIEIHLNIPFEEAILVSKEKMTTFLHWLEGAE